MSTEQDKFKHSKRLLKDENAINKQVKIAKAAGVTIDEPHKFVKHHALDCGNPECPTCSNPRKRFKQLTTQEQRLFQDVDTPRDRRSNGSKYENE